MDENAVRGELQAKEEEQKRIPSGGRQSKGQGAGRVKLACVAASYQRR
jgi:hypothetical protein